MSWYSDIKLLLIRAGLLSTKKRAGFSAGEVDGIRKQVAHLRAKAAELCLRTERQMKKPTSDSEGDSY